MATTLSVGDLQFVGGGVIRDGRWEQLTQAEIDALAAAGENGIQFEQVDGRTGTIKSGVAESYAFLSDLEGLATETYVGTAVSNLEAAIKDGVDPSQDTFAEVKVITDSMQANISALDSSKASQAEVDAIQANIDQIEALLASDDLDLDTLQEVVDFIKNNKSLIDGMTIAAVAGLQDALDAKLDASVYNAFIASQPNHVTLSMTGGGVVDADGHYSYSVNATTGYSFHNVNAWIDDSEFAGVKPNSTYDTLTVSLRSPLGASEIKIKALETKNA